LLTWASSTSLKDTDMVRFSIMTLLFGVKIEISGEKEALPVGFSGKARYLQVSMHVSYKK
jgi:hypothetical protein